jgi:hypothetical protein
MNSKQITIHRVPLSLRYYESLRMYGGEPGLSRCVFAYTVVFADRRHSGTTLQVTPMLRVLGHFSLMRGHAGREALS